VQAQRLPENNRFAEMSSMMFIGFSAEPALSLIAET
jgi:hypothetical protein